jgi:GT2 family glycosyltransferase
VLMAVLSFEKFRGRVGRAVRLLALWPLRQMLRLSEGTGDWDAESPNHDPVRSETFRWHPGISILIPERDNLDILHECLNAAQVSTTHCPEPCELIVVVDGTPASRYRSLQGEFPSVRWIFLPHPGGFNEAIETGLPACTHDWVYLLNSDMVLDPAALAGLLPWRAAGTFALSSQIYFQDSTRRREETGWTDILTADDGLMAIYDREPDSSGLVRGNCYGGGGASLFQRRLLQRHIAETRAFRPFYWEDAAWGMFAWEEGFQMLFCPASIAWHRHRATISRFYPAREIERIFRRNRLQFIMRRPAMNSITDRRVLSAIACEGWRTTGELLHPGRVLENLRARRRAVRRSGPKRQSCFATNKYYLRPHGQLSGKPVILLVTPYALFPPIHGAAVRIDQLLRRLQQEFHFVVLSDEAEAYGTIDATYLQCLASLHLVGGRSTNPISPGDRLMRSRVHCHDSLRAELRALKASFKPAAILIEHLELAPLKEDYDGDSTPWVLTLHEAPFPEERAAFTEADRMDQRWLECYDAVVACSMEDASTLDHREVHIIPNGLSLPRTTRRDSRGRRSILFLGPFRYQPNWDGITRFLREIYPQLKSRVPDMELWILGGPGARARALSESCFQQPGVQVHEWVEDITPWLDGCAVTINPQERIRGSSIKVADSLAAGRVCVSTRDGSRGFAEERYPGLIIVDRFEDFTASLERLLTDETRRISLEAAPDSLLRKLDWEVSARKLSALLQRLAGRPLRQHPGGMHRV